MDKQLSPETERALRAVVREFWTLRHLDEDTQEEWYAHLEDKTLGYLAGDESLSEADAVLLARKHFDSSGLLLKDGSESKVPVRSAMFARRLAAMAVVDLALGVALASVVAEMAVILRQTTTRRAVLPLDLFGGVWSAVPVVLVVFCTSYMFWMWRRGSDAGQRVWYLRWKRQTFVLVLGVLLLVRWWLPGRADFLGVPRMSLDQGPVGFNKMGVAALVLPLLWAWIWVRWTARVNSSVPALVSAGTVWFLLRLSSGTLEHLVGSAALSQGNSGAWVYVPGALFRHSDSFFAIPLAFLQVLWNTWLLHFPLFMLVVVAYGLKRYCSHVLRFSDNSRGGVPWVTD